MHAQNYLYLDLNDIYISTLDKYFNQWKHLPSPIKSKEFKDRR